MGCVPRRRRDGWNALPIRDSLTRVGRPALIRGGVCRGAPFQSIPARMGCVPWRRRGCCDGLPNQDSLTRVRRPALIRGGVYRGAPFQSIPERMGCVPRRWRGGWNGLPIRDSLIRVGRPTLLWGEAHQRGAPHYFLPERGWNQRGVARPEMSSRAKAALSLHTAYCRAICPVLPEREGRCPVRWRSPREGYTLQSGTPRPYRSPPHQETALLRAFGCPTGAGGEAAPCPGRLQTSPSKGANLWARQVAPPHSERCLSSLPGDCYQPPPAPPRKGVRSNRRGKTLFGLASGDAVCYSRPLTKTPDFGLKQKETETWLKSDFAEPAA